MTTVIDERVVEMRFNNADFEKNVAQSMDTLDKLKKSLNMDSAKSLDGLSQAAKGFSLSSVSERTIAHPIAISMNKIPSTPRRYFQG
jgi:hypothetical protein